MKICSKCVTPETAESLIFDENNTCSACKQISFKNEKVDWAGRKVQFENLIAKHKNKFDYDCIVPFSGGKDSTFALWYIVKIKNLKPLVVRFDHNFLRETVQKNTEKTITKLGVDFLNFKPNFNIVKKMMFESLFRRGDFCWHCHVGVSAFPIRVAIEKNVPLLIYGEPSAEYGSFYNYKNPEFMDVERFNKTGNLGINAEDMVGMIKQRYPNEKIDERDFKPFIFPSQKELNEKNIVGTFLGNYIPWDVKEQVKIIKKELNWEGDEVEGIPEEYDYEKIECYMQGVRDYIKFIKRGFGRTSHLVSIDIRNNRMSREQGMKLVKEYDGKRPKSLDFFLGLVKMTEDEFYNTIFTHIVEPNQKLEKDYLIKNTTNKVPKDFINWEKKF
jgi:N-acetyl sugar amidotransferase